MKYILVRRKYSKDYKSHTDFYVVREGVTSQKWEEASKFSLEDAIAIRNELNNKEPNEEMIWVIRYVKEEENK